MSSHSRSAFTRKSRNAVSARSDAARNRLHSSTRVSYVILIVLLTDPHRFLFCGLAAQHLSEFSLTSQLLMPGLHVCAASAQHPICCDPVCRSSELARFAVEDASSNVVRSGVERSASWAARR